MIRKYAASRNCWENYEKRQFYGVGRYGIPPIYGCDIIEIPELIGFNTISSCESPQDKAVHFFLDDYQFERVWADPIRQMERLKKFRYVLSPDFSTYTDFPMALQIYAHYRKHWVGRLWEENGVKVIPTISWGDEASYSWCFDGEPIGGTVAVSSQGTQNSEGEKELFLNGYEAMCERLQPKTVIFYGTIPAECKGNIVQIKPFTDKFRIAKMEVR